jgi:hypothetical protein
MISFYFMAILSAALILFGKVFSRLSRTFNESGGNCLLGHVKHLVWKVEENTAKSINGDICLYFY